MRYLIYKYEDVAAVPAETDIKFKVWSPGPGHPVPNGLSKKYLIFYFFHLAHIFKNRRYCAVQGYKNGKMVCSLLVVPKYYKWPFMGSRDVQLVYVKTHPEYRGQGLGHKLLTFTLSHLQQADSNIWYVTDTDNAASMALAEKSGFRLFAYGKKGFLHGIKFLPILQQE